MHKLLKELRDESISHVEVMPASSGELDPLELTPNEIAALQRVTSPDFVATEEEEERSMRLPPAQRPRNIDQDDTPWMAGVPSEGDYRERLNAGAHIDKLVAKQQEEARKAHQDALKSGQAKIKAGNARRKSELDAARDELNRETASKAKESWVDAAAYWISNAKR